MVHMEEAYRLLGDFGKWQRIQLCLMIGPGIACGLHTMVGVFLTATTEYRCKVPGAEGADPSYAPFPTFALSNLSYVPTSGMDQFRRCHYYRNYTTEPDGSQTPDDPVECEEHVFDRGTYETSITMELDLVCKKSIFARIAQSSFMLGMLLGAIVFGMMSDKFGRKKAIMTALVLQLIFGMTCGAAPELISYCVVKMLIGMTQSGVYLTTYVMTIELMGDKWRTGAGVAIGFSFGIGYMLVVPFAYFIRTWRWLQFAITVPNIIFLAYFWLIPESIRWSVAKGRDEEAAKTIKRASTVNLVEIPDWVLKTKPRANSDTALTEMATLKIGEGDEQKDDKMSSPETEPRVKKSASAVTFNIGPRNASSDSVNDALKSSLNNCDDKEAEDRKSSAMPPPGLQRDPSAVSMEFEASEAKQGTTADLVSTPNMRKKSLIVFYEWFVVSMCYYALGLGTGGLRGDPYIIFLLMGFIDIPAKACQWVAIEKFGRQASMCGAQMLCAISLFLVAMNVIDNTIAIATLSIFGKGFASAGFGIIYQYSSELFPTVVRNNGIGMSSMCARVGGILAPLIGEIDNYAPSFSMWLLSMCSLLGGLLILVLPETKGAKLPESVEDGEKFGKDAGLASLISRISGMCRKSEKVPPTPESQPGKNL